MKIEIHGGQFRNKGAQKMLRTIVDKLRNIDPNIEIYCDPVCGTKEQLNSVGVNAFSFSRGWMGGRLFVLKMFIQILLGRVKIGTQFTNMDIMIDISGFSYSDQWGYKPTKHAALLASYYKKRNKKVFLMPQAFGPFESDEIRMEIQKLIHYSDRAWVRDKMSHEYLIKAVGENTKIRRAPDITQNFKVTSNAKHKVYKQKARLALIPNVRMRAATSFQNITEYVGILEQAASSPKIEEAVVIIHDDTGEDYDLVRTSTKLKQLTVINLSDAEELKKKISEFDLVISSRYHGLIAALSQNIPVISLGWSHKYVELMNEYGLGRYHIPDNAIDVNMLINELFQPENFGVTSAAIRKKNNENFDDLETLWCELGELLYA